ncbi:DEAD/DEAH box helicase [Thorsellia anophelis]|uniref:Type III restriction enzyme, res subunit n=1 Tax=Thorsellia anophelis DSM 18579 TaxID=1123402 RepID=A0A1I0A011_9GAMM|nr:DEAD/DEAH box helicase [Thorsellia anophelis]SES87359.1 Type III restriction enzyme, res subunit [Thorsellia anophelis DSM 18579]
MSHNFKGWDAVAARLIMVANDLSIKKLNAGQRASLVAIAKRLVNNGVIIADEVGMGKTRIAALVSKAIVDCGGRVAIIVPPGLGYQWNSELADANINSPPKLIRSLYQYLASFSSDENVIPYEQSITLISQLFMNWRLSEKSEVWRWSLLPQVYGKWRKSQSERFPNKYHKNDKCDWNAEVDVASDKIVQFLERISKSNYKSKLIKRIEYIYDNTPWPNALNAKEYKNDEYLRPFLESAVGLGLGEFDLIIIDEAHKSRKAESGLNKMLTNLLVESASARRIAITATPVELYPQQWLEIFSRINVDVEVNNQIKSIINEYIQSVKDIQTFTNNPIAKKVFMDSAKKFEVALSPFLLRRDKRQDEHVQKFRDKMNGLNDYRQEKSIEIELETLTDEWKRSICAAEAISIVSRGSDENMLKRLRLTLANGHGLSSCIDEMTKAELEEKTLEEELVNEGEGLKQSTNIDYIEINSLEVVEQKRIKRLNYWKSIMAKPFSSENQGTSIDLDVLYDHPAILATVNKIEELVENTNEKVLVFGRFNKPLSALTHLLNTRQMLKALVQNCYWPQQQLNDQQEKILPIAIRQLVANANLTCEQKILLSSLRDIKICSDKLKTQYHQSNNIRAQNRKKLIQSLITGFDDLGEKISSISAKLSDEFNQNQNLKALFDAFHSQVNKENTIHANDSEITNNNSALNIVSRALFELVDANDNKSNETRLVDAFISLVSVLREHNEGDKNDDGELDKYEAEELWSILYERIKEEYNSHDGKFARLLNGSTKPETRRLLQLAFNREQSFPKVLIAQSVVGREGLNLHQACRYVILFHPEWNPGVVEQQIGRVDRLGSLWHKKLDQFLEENSEISSLNEIPKIEIFTVIFKGTYDEINWNVLKSRWSDLKAQLHGIIIPTRDNCSDEEAKLILEINKNAPYFSPE